MVREVQVRRLQKTRQRERELIARFPFVCPSQEYFADYLTLLPSLFTLSLPPVSPTPKVSVYLFSSPSRS